MLPQTPKQINKYKAERIKKTFAVPFLPFFNCSLPIEAKTIGGINITPNKPIINRIFNQW